MSIQLDFENTEQLNIDFVDDDTKTGQRLRQFFSINDKLVTFKIPIESSLTLSQLIQNQQLKQFGDYIPLLYVLEDFVDFYITALDDGYYFNRIQEDNIYFLLKPQSTNDQQIIFNRQQFIGRNYQICIADAPSQINGVLQEGFQKIIEQTLKNFHGRLDASLAKSRVDLPEIVNKFIENMRYVTQKNQITGFKRVNEIRWQQDIQSKTYELIFDYKQQQIQRYTNNDEINNRFYNYQCQQIYQNCQQIEDQNFNKIINLLQSLEKNQSYITQDVPFILFLQQQQYLNIYESLSQQQLQSNDKFVKYFEENVKITYLYGYLVRKGILNYLQNNKQEPDQCINELISNYVSEIGTMTQSFLSDDFIKILQKKEVQQNKFERDIKKVVIELVLSKQ